jgi:hypothetical protein
VDRHLRVVQRGKDLRQEVIYLGHRQTLLSLRVAEFRALTRADQAESASSA